MDRLEDFLVIQLATIHDCLKLIEKNKHRTVFVVDDSLRLVGSITDGDIRKALINRISIDSPIQTLVNVNCVSISLGEKIDFLALKKNYPEISVFPVVENDVVVGVQKVY